MFALPDWWWRKYRFDLLIGAVVVGIIALVVLGAWADYHREHDCMAAGYTQWKDGFCVRQVKGTDEMIPYAEVAK